MRLALVALLVPSFAHAEDFLVDHPDASWWLSAQANVITQAQPGFHSPYAGVHSFVPEDHEEHSFVGTVFAGYEVTPYTAVIVTGESAAGGGLSTALGIAGFTNLDVVRNPTLGSAPYIGRAFIDQVIPLGGANIAQDRSPLDILRHRRARHLEVWAGKLSTADFFDTNAIGSDSHFQFMNWTVDNNGAYDYAADTRGYTLGGVVEYAAPLWAVRYGLLLMPTVANGIDYDYDLAKARGENLEVELHECIGGHAGIVRLLGFWNHANMGRYKAANIPVEQHIVDTPEIEPTRAPGRVKYGFGANVEQEVTSRVRAYARVGWNEGHFESFAYTEVDNTVAAGADVALRRADRLGLAAVTNGISEDHREYLRLGGSGFILGDGRLRYGREDIVEAYYTARAFRGVYPAVDVQAIAHPGYNVDRGPVVVGSLRLHVEI